MQPSSAGSRGCDELCVRPSSAGSRGCDELFVGPSSAGSRGCDEHKPRTGFFLGGRGGGSTVCYNLVYQL